MIHHMVRAPSTIRDRQNERDACQGICQISGYSEKNKYQRCWQAKKGQYKGAEMVKAFVKDVVKEIFWL